MGDKGKYLENEVGCFICGKRPTQWKLISPQAEKVPLCKRHYSNSKITDVAWLNRKLWYHRTKGGYEGKKCYLCGEPVIAFLDTASDKAFAKDFTEEWVQNIQQVCIDHVTPESRDEFLANIKD
ncbi:MAG TPA: hypothetical protein G4O12_06830 [Dehalococcoidia bacterium]|nr:hypothetical protein [Dehalococcoidia bacterium]